MLVQPFTTKFSSIGEQVFLRCDPKYRHFWDNKNGVSIKQNALANVKLKGILLPFSKAILRKGELDEERPILELSDIESRTSLTLQERVVTEIGSDKLNFADCDLLFNRLEPYLGKIVINDKSKRYIGTTEWIPLRLDPEKVKPTFLKYLLLLPPFLYSFGLLKSGKRHARIAQVDLQNMIVPLLSKEQQAEIQERIAPVEERMVSLHQSIAKPLNIVNRVFAREFRYDLEEYENLATQHIYQRALTDIDNSFLLRSSVKFQHPKYEYVDRILSRHPWVKLKTLIKRGCKIHKGVVPEYSGDGEVMVLKTINLKHGSIDYEVCDFVSQEFWQANKQAYVSQGDILISCHGEGRGKVDIYDKDEPAIIDINTAVVAIDPDRINPFYCTYFMQSLLGKLQFERLESETKAVRYMQPENLKEMRIIDPARKKQDAIVEEVGVEIQELQKQRIQIHRLRDQIDELLMQALCAS